MRSTPDNGHREFGRRGFGRRRLLGTTLAVGTAVPLGIVAGASAARAETGPAPRPAPPVRPTPAPGPTPPPRPALTLPPPTGPHRVGVVDLHIVDRTRPDPAAGPGRFRELMISVWYPARETGRFPLVPWMPAATIQPYLTDLGFDPSVLPSPLTAGHDGAPVLRPGRRLPVLLYSHGAHSHRADNTVVAQELASHGFAVVTISHTYDTYVVFPDGRVLTPDHGRPMGPPAFAADARSVLDAVAELAAGRNPDADGKPLPRGLAGALDLERIGMFGWSKGGTATAYTMLGDARVRAGLSFDGPMAPVITTDLDRPFMMMTAVFTRAADPDVAGFWSHLKGWHLNVQPDGAEHSCYSDAESLVTQVAKIVGLSQEEVQGYIGTLDPAEGVHLQQAYPLAFFEQQLKGRRSRLLEGPSPSFPDVKYLP